MRQTLDTQIDKTRMTHLRYKKKDEKCSVLIRIVLKMVAALSILKGTN